MFFYFADSNKEMKSVRNISNMLCYQHKSDKQKMRLCPEKML